jgi:polysaccharide biosynthesis/export protein
MRNLFIVFFVFIILWGLSSCSDKQYQILFEKRSEASDTSYNTKSTGLENYKIKPQDLLQIRNLQHAGFIVDETPTSVTNNNTNAQMNFAGQVYQVEEDGTVALPVIGSVQIAGLTRLEAQKLVRELYRKTLLNDPIIELKITNLKVTLLGEVRSQGNISLTKDKTTLTEIIAQAGGLTDKANEKTVKIIRGTSKNPSVSVIDLNTLASINDPRTVLQNGDIIYVAESKRAARGDNIQNYSAILQPLSLLLNTIVILFTLNRIR